MSADTSKTMTLNIRIWRQKNAKTPGKLVEYKVEGVSPDMSFLEMLDHLNEHLYAKGEEPVAFDHDCREGICGMCSLNVNGIPHGPDKGVTICQTHMRLFHDGQTITIEPWRSHAFPVIKDCVVDRGAFDRIMQAGGFISVNTGGTPDANALPISKKVADLAMDAAACIGCGACVAACKNSSAMLFVSAKASQLNLLPQGKVEKDQRVLKMVDAMDKEGFGACTNTNSCEAVCPKEIPVTFIAKLNRDYAWAMLKGAASEGKARVGGAG